MKKLSMASKIVLAVAVLSVVVNLIFFGSLPDKVAMQIGISGEARNFVPKALFMIIAPAAAVFSFIYVRMAEASKAGKAVIVSIIIFAANFIMILFNLR